MRFRVEQRFESAAENIFTAYCEPGVYPRFVALDQLDTPEVAEHRVAADGRTTLRVVYRYVGDLPGGTHRFIDTSNITVTEAVTYDPTDLTGSFALSSALGSRFRGSGTSSVADGPDGGSIRVMQGELQIGIPMIGRRIEEVIIDGYRETLAAQVAVIEGWAATSNHDRDD